MNWKELPNELLWPTKFHINANWDNFPAEFRDDFLKYFQEVSTPIYQTELQMKEKVELKTEDIPTKNKNENITLITGYYAVEDERFHEIQEAIQNNINNPHISEVVLFIQPFVNGDTRTEEELLNDFDCKNKVTLVKATDRMSYKLALNYVKEHKKKDTIYILTNNDCYFDKNDELIKKIDFKKGKRVLTFTRKDRLADGTIVNAVNPSPGDEDGVKFDETQTLNYEELPTMALYSSDAWAFTPKLADTNATVDMQLGRSTCEEQFHGRIYEDGYELYNVGINGFIKCIHLHLSGLRHIKKWKEETDFDDWQYVHNFRKGDHTEINETNYINGSWMAYHPNNFYYDDRFSGKFGKFFVRDIRKLF